jgi:arylsulfatase A-like enzyme
MTHHRAGAFPPPLAAFAAAALGSGALLCVEETCWRLSGHSAELAALLPALSAYAVASGVLAAVLTFLRSWRTAVATPVVLTATVSAASALETTLDWPRSLALVAAVPAGLAVLGVALAARRKERWFLIGLSLITLVPWSTPPAVRSAPLRAPVRADLPDIVLIVMDTTRKDHLSVYGYPQATTPALESIGKDAAVYENAWSVAPWTSPSHASMLTGLLPSQHGVDGQNFPVFPSNLVSLPRVLAEAGYRTAGFVANPNLTAPGWSAQFHDYRPPYFRGRHLLIRALNRFVLGSGDPWVMGGTESVFRRARTWWDHHHRTVAPRFAMINVMDPHEPYRPPERYYRAFLPDVDPREAYAIDQDPLDSHARPGFSARQAEIVRGLYDAEIRAMDDHIGAFVDWLRSRGELDHTLVIVTADHGERLGERGLLGHEALMDAYLLRVPLIVRYPPVVPAERVRRLVQLDGLPGYVLHLVGLPVPASMNVHRLDRQDQVVVVAQHRMPAWFEASMLRRRPDMDVARFRGEWFFVANARYAYVCSPTNPRSPLCMLDDLQADPDWTHDCSEEHPEVVEALAKLGGRLPTFHGLQPAAQDPEALERLRSLGYAN